MSLNSIWNLFKDSLIRFSEDNGFTNSGNIAYCTILSIFPFIISVFATVSLLADESMAQNLIDALLTIGPRELIDPLRDEITALLTGQRHDLLTISGAITIWTASRAVESLRTGLNRAYGYVETRSWWVRIIHDFIAVVFGAIMVFLISFTLVISPVMWATAQKWFPQMQQFDLHFDAIRLSLGTLGLFTALLAGHIFLPSKKLPILKLLPGVLFTMTLWLIMASAYAYYLKHFAYFASLYAGLSGLFAALIFIYLSATLFQFGGEFNRIVNKSEMP